MFSFTLESQKALLWHHFWAWLQVLLSAWNLKKISHHFTNSCIFFLFLHSFALFNQALLVSMSVNLSQDTWTSLLAYLTNFVGHSCTPHSQDRGCHLLIAFRHAWRKRQNGLAKEIVTLLVYWWGSWRISGSCCSRQSPESPVEGTRHRTREEVIASLPCWKKERRFKHESRLKDSQDIKHERRLKFDQKHLKKKMDEY